jgi:uncharacterized protein (DUF779 family)
MFRVAAKYNAWVHGKSVADVAPGRAARAPLAE